MAKARSLAASLDRPVMETGEKFPPISIEEEADRWLGGGLRADALHEFYAGEATDRTAASAFALLLADIRVKSGGGAVVWVIDRTKAEARPYGPGLAELGIDPGRITLLPLAKPRDVLRAGLDCVREGGVAAVLIELTGRQPLVDLTATRRLQLAAQDKGTSVFLLRGDSEAMPSAAATRWRVRAAPSSMLDAQAPGHPAFALQLTRQRGGREGLNLLLEWNRDTASFRSVRYRPRQTVRHGQEAAPLSGAFPAVASG